MHQTGYDRLVESVIPGYSSLARLSVSLLATSPQARSPGAAVLVAGCGSGAELLAARTLRPDWLLTALDPDPEMLAIAQQKLEADGKGADTIRWVRGTVEDLPAQPVFDGALAVLVLQGLPDDGRKLTFLSSLSRTLQPGSQVVLVDQMQPERNGIEEQLLAASRLFQREALANQSTGASLDVLGELHPISRARLAGLLETTGFSDPLPVFRALDTEGFLCQRLP